VEIDGDAAPKVQSSCVRLPPESAGFKQLTRITVQLDDTAQVHTLVGLNRYLPAAIK
jgi:hypothetical protein